MFDLDQLDTTLMSNSGFDLQLFRPDTGALVPLFINILGQDSDVFQQVQNDQNRRRVGRVKFGVSRNQVASLAEVRADTIELLVACTQGWYTMEEQEQPEETGSEPLVPPVPPKKVLALTIGGVAYEFSKENAKMLYTKYTWIREQADLGVGDRANFIRSSLKPSSSSSSAK